jgi:DNA-binding transcriptional ArsR family regulator
VDTAARETLVLDRPEQLKALGHPLRVRALEVLANDETPRTNRELAQQLGVDPGHLHFHVRMLLRSGLIELVDTGGRGRERPYRAVARTVEVHPDLLAGGGATGVQEAMLADVGRSLGLYGAEGRVRSIQASLRVPAERLLELMKESLERAEREERSENDPAIVTVFIGPRAPAPDEAS